MNQTEYRLVHNQKENKLQGAYLTYLLALIRIKRINLASPTSKPYFIGVYITINT